MGAAIVLAVLSDFAALALQVLTVIGCIYDTPFLRDLYFARLELKGVFIDFGLWNYCIGVGDRITECIKPKTVFNWASATGLDSITEAFDNNELLFKASFILYLIGIGLTLVAMVLTFSSRSDRSSKHLAFIFTLVSAGVMVTLFAIYMILCMKGLERVRDYGVNASGSLGPSMWMTLGAMVALLFSSLLFILSFCGGSSRAPDLEKD